MAKNLLVSSRAGTLTSRLVDHTLFVPPLTGADYWRMLIRQAHIVLIVFLIFSVMGALYALIKQPVFEASMMLQIGTGTQHNVLVGNDRPANESLSNASSEIELLKSRAVVGRAVEDLSLNIGVSPRFFPVIGRKLSSYGFFENASELPLLGGFCWGAEKILVGSFDVPRQLMGKKFRIVMNEKGTYSLLTPTAGEVFQGTVGKHDTFSSATGPISLEVRVLEAKPGQTFTVERKADISVIEDIQKALSVSESSKASNIIKVAYKSNSAGSAYLFLKALSARYLELAGQARTGDVARSLSVASSELPELKRRMDLSEEKYNALRRHYGVASIGELGTVNVQRVASLKERLSDLGRRRVELRSRFEPSHPMLLSIDEQIRSLEAERAETERLIRQVPAIEQQLQQLASEAKVNSDLYLSVLRSSKELKLTAENLSRDVRVVDEATEPMDRTDSPVRVFLIASFLGLVFGAALALLVGIIKRKSA